MDRIFRAVPVDAIFAGYDGRGRGLGREKFFSVILSIYAGFTTLHSLSNWLGIRERMLRVKKCQNVSATPT